MPTSHKIETLDLIEIKFGTYDHVRKMTPGAKFHANPSTGASWQMGKIYAKFLLFSQTHLKVRPVLARDMFKRRGLTQGQG